MDLLLRRHAEVYAINSVVLPPSKKSFYWGLGDTCKQHEMAHHVCVMQSKGKLTWEPGELQESAWGFDGNKQEGNFHECSTMMGATHILGCLNAAIKEL